MGRQQTASEVPKMELKSTMRRYNLGILEVKEHFDGKGNLESVNISDVSPLGRHGANVTTADLPLLVNYLQRLVKD